MPKLSTENRVKKFYFDHKWDKETHGKAFALFAFSMEKALANKYNPSQIFDESLCGAILLKAEKQMEERKQTDLKGTLPPQEVNMLIAEIKKKKFKKINESMILETGLDKWGTKDDYFADKIFPDVNITFTDADKEFLSHTYKLIAFSIAKQFKKPINDWEVHNIANDAINTSLAFAHNQIQSKLIEKIIENTTHQYSKLQKKLSK